MARDRQVPRCIRGVPSVALSGLCTLSACASSRRSLTSTLQQNYIRMYSYQSHYEVIDQDMSEESPQERSEHKDHCIETLRQRLMCTPDLNIITSHWRLANDIPNIDLHSNHQCVDWEKFYEWTKRNVYAEKDSNTLRKPAGYVID